MFRHLLLSILIFPLVLATSPVYVSPVQSCGQSCLGTSSNPYDNLLIALVQNQAEDPLEVILLKGSSPHFIHISFFLYKIQQPGLNLKGSHHEGNSTPYSTPLQSTRLEVN